MGSRGSFAFDYVVLLIGRRHFRRDALLAAAQLAVIRTGVLSHGVIHYGGDSTSVQSQLTDVQHIYASSWRRVESRGIARLD